MEVIGGISGVITLLDAAQKITQTVRRLKKAHPEFNDLLDRVEAIVSVVKSYSDIVSASGGTHDILHPLTRLKVQLLDLEKLMHFKLVKSGPIPQVSRIAWVQHASDISKSLNEISGTMTYISSMLSANTLSATIAMQSQLLRMEGFTASSSENQNRSMILLATEMCDTRVIFEQLLSSKEQQDKQILDLLRQVTLGTPMFSPADNGEDDAHRQSHNQETASASSSAPQPEQSLMPQGSHRISASCPMPCRCQCHTKTTVRLPHSLRYWVGSLNVSFTSIRNRDAPCNVPSCRKRGDSKANVHYAFPPWLAAMMISVSYKKSIAGSVDRLIRIVNVVDTGARYYVMKGDLESLRWLYENGQASIHDAEPVSGYTALTTAVDWQKRDIVRYLLNNGADPSQEDCAGRDVNAVALDRYLFPNSTDSGYWCALFQVEDTMEELQFTPIHYIVLGRSSRMLEEELQERPKLLNAPDRLGRTPLHWTIYQRNLEAMETLLHWGADISLEDCTGNNIFHQVANDTYKGLDMFSVITRYIQPGVAGMERVRSLLNAQNSIGGTPLLSALYSDQTALVEHLLDYAPDTSKKTFFGSTLFHMATTFASTQTLLTLCSIDLSAVDLLVVEFCGTSAMDYAVARVSGNSYWACCPPHSPEDTISVVKLVAHARRFEPRLPRLLYGCKSMKGGYHVGWGLFYTATESSKIEDEWDDWEDVEVWVSEHGDLGFLDIWEYPVVVAEDGDEMSGECDELSEQEM